MYTRSLAALFVVVAVVVLVCGAFVLAQQPQPKQQKLFVASTPSPKIITGDEIGFRVDGYKDGVPVGTVVVKVDGKWVEPLPPPPTARFAR
jgi:hypothetical protein